MSGSDFSVSETIARPAADRLTSYLLSIVDNPVQSIRQPQIARLSCSAIY
ncbi:MAG: hypothetical protein NZ523_11130 [Elioraea sp.]|nr:hypothetical protein [Elioraea sp.]